MREGNVGKQLNICDIIYLHPIFQICLCQEILFPDEVYENIRKALKSCPCVLPWDTIGGLCKVFVHRVGVNPSSMDGDPDLLDHNRFFLNS